MRAKRGLLSPSGAPDANRPWSTVIWRLGAARCSSPGLSLWLQRAGSPFQRVSLAGVLPLDAEETKARGVAGLARVTEPVSRRALDQALLLGCLWPFFTSYSPGEAGSWQGAGGCRGILRACGSGKEREAHPPLLPAMTQCPGPREDHRRSWRGGAAAAKGSLHLRLPPPPASAQDTLVPALPGRSPLV